MHAGVEMRKEFAIRVFGQNIDGLLNAFGGDVFHTYLFWPRRYDFFAISCWQLAFGWLTAETIVICLCLSRTLKRLSCIFFELTSAILKKYYFCNGFSFGKLRGGKSRYEVWK